jgi:type IV pilus assembly protein PilW
VKHFRERAMPAKSRFTRANGFSVVELMVSIVLSLIGTIVIFQVYAVNEDVRRSTTAGSDEQTNGLLALVLLERELRMAGYGINDTDLIGCKMATYDNQRTPNFPPEYPLAPVQIVSNASAIPDVLRVIYAGVTNTTVPVKLAADLGGVQNFPVVRYAYGYRPGNMIVLGESGTKCTIREITLINGIELQTANGSYVDWKGVSKSTRWNNPLGVPQSYSSDGKVINLGDLTDDTHPPRYNEITVQTGLSDPSQNNKLVIQNLWGQTASFAPLADQIVQFKVEYGMDDGQDNGTVAAHPLAKGDGVVDRYTADSPTTPADWRLVKTVRLAIVARTIQAYKPTVGSACDATPDFDPDLNKTTYPVRWARGPDAPNGRPIDVRGGLDWRCYRYRVFESTIPLRNVLWSVT